MVLLLPACLLHGCGDGGDDAPVDAARPPDADLSQCLMPAERTMACQASARGDMIDLQTGMLVELGGVPVPGYVRVNTGWDGPTALPVTCNPLAQGPIPANTGTFNLGAVDCASPLHPPYLVFMIDDAAGAPNRLAATATDVWLTCAGEDCGSVDITVEVLLAAVLEPWRLEMEEDGIPDARTRGIAVVSYRETDGTQAQGVAPTVMEAGGERTLVPGTEVRFLDATRVALLSPTAVATSQSGIALVVVDGETAQIGGQRAPDAWAPQGVIFSQGFTFMKTLSLP